MTLRNITEVEHEDSAPTTPQEKREHFTNSLTHAALTCIHELFNAGERNALIDLDDELRELIRTADDDN